MESRRYHGLEDEWVVCRSRLDVSLARLIEKYRGDAPSGQSFCELLTTRSCIRCTRCIHTHMRSSRHILHPTRTRESARWSEHLPVIRFLGLTLLRARILSFSLSLSLSPFFLSRSNFLKFTKRLTISRNLDRITPKFQTIEDELRRITSFRNLHFRGDSFQTILPLLIKNKNSTFRSTNIYSKLGLSSRVQLFFPTETSYSPVTTSGPHPFRLVFE